MRIGRVRAVRMFYGDLKCDHNFVPDEECHKSHIYPHENFSDVIRFFRCTTCSFCYQVTRSISKSGKESCNVYEIIDEDNCRTIYTLPSCKERIMSKALE